MTLKEQLSAETAKAEAAAASLTELQAKIETAEAATAAEVAKLTEAEAKFETLSGELATAKLEVEEVADKLATAEGEKATLTEDLAASKAETEQAKEAAAAAGVKPITKPAGAAAEGEGEGGGSLLEKYQALKAEGKNADAAAMLADPKQKAQLHSEQRTATKRAALAGSFD